MMFMEILLWVSGQRGGGSDGHASAACRSESAMKQNGVDYRVVSAARASTGSNAERDAA
jgi:hypothetical protein